MDFSSESEDSLDQIQRFVDQLSMIGESLKEIDWAKIDSIFGGKRSDCKIFHSRMVLGLWLLSRYPALYIDFNGLCTGLAGVPPAQRRGVRYFFDKFCKKMDGLVDVCWVSFRKHQDRSIDASLLHLRPYGALVPNPDHSRRLTVSISKEAMYPMPRRAYRLRPASETGWEDAIIFMQATGFLYEPIRKAPLLKSKQFLETATEKVYLFVLERLYGMMIHCNLMFEDAVSYELEAIKQSFKSELASYRANRIIQPNVRYRKPLALALEIRNNMQSSFAHYLPEQNRWVFKCTLCGSHTDLGSDQSNEPKKVQCRICETQYNLAERVER